MNNDIYISGLTPLNKIPKPIYSLPHKKTCLTHKLSLSKTRSEIKKIIGLKIKTNVSSYKKSFTSSSIKTIINAVNNIQVTYYSTNDTIHTAKFNIPFSIPIPLKNSAVIIKNTFNYVTNLSIKMLNGKSFLLYSTVFSCLLLEIKNTKKTYNKKGNNQNFNNQHLNNITNNKNLNNKKGSNQNFNNQQLNNITNNKNSNNKKGSNQNFNNQHLNNIINNKNLNNKKGINQNFSNEKLINIINNKNSNNTNLHNKKKNISYNNTQSNKHMNSNCNICWDSYYCLILVLVLLSKLSPFAQRPYRYYP